MEEFAKSICFDLGVILPKATQDKTVLSGTPLFIKSPYWERTIRFDLIAMFPHLLYFKSYKTSHITNRQCLCCLLVLPLSYTVCHIMNKHV